MCELHAAASLACRAWQSTLPATHLSPKASKRPSLRNLPEIVIRTPLSIYIWFKDHSLISGLMEALGIVDICAASPNGGLQKLRALFGSRHSK